MELRIEGMSCGNCVQHVTKALRAVPGVVAVEVDLGKGAATVHGQAQRDSLIAAVRDAGYDAA